MEPGVSERPGLPAQENPPPARRAREPRTIKLEEPIRFGTEEIGELVLQPITGAQMRAVPLPKPGAMTMGYFLDLASLASGRPDDIFDRLCPQDVMAVVNEVAAMVGPSAGTSDKA